ncbi:MAG TPA: hypothetical protein VFR67_03660 [Pilimelia sp.]|nr:hypothetical protein [Pilimelia sp.]
MEGERRRRRLRRGPQPATDTGPDPGGRGAVPDAGRRGTAPDSPARASRPNDSYADTAPLHDPEPDLSRPTATSADEREAERGLRGLVGSGTSQVRTGAALRARDAARPTEEDLAAAEEHLVIVRRNWVPRDDLPRTR